MLDPEELPALRRELELRRKMVELAEHATTAAKEQVQAHLDDVEKAEIRLREIQPE